MNNTLFSNFNFGQTYNSCVLANQDNDNLNLQLLVCAPVLCTLDGGRSSSVPQFIDATQTEPDTNSHLTAWRLELKHHADPRLRMCPINTQARPRVEHNEISQLVRAAMAHGLNFADVGTTFQSRRAID